MYLVQQTCDIFKGLFTPRKSERAKKIKQQGHKIKEYVTKLKENVRFRFVFRTMWMGL